MMFRGCQEALQVAWNFSCVVPPWHRAGACWGRWLTYDVPYSISRCRLPSVEVVEVGQVLLFEHSSDTVLLVLNTGQQAPHSLQAPDEM